MVQVGASAGELTDARPLIGLFSLLIGSGGGGGRVAPGPTGGGTGSGVGE